MENEQHAAETRIRALEDALQDILDEYDRQSCTHETVRRAGVIWTVCEDCDYRWSDDEGGFKPYRDPPKVARARRLIAKRPVCEAV